ncbi:MAG: hypothetical protein ACLS6B_04520, partial [Clostridium sp.]
GNTGSGTYTAGSSSSGGPGVSLSAGKTQATPTVGASTDSQTGPSGQAGQQDQTGASPVQTAGQDESQLTKSPSEQ